jgi:restriction endonuclease S subunit
VDDLVLSKIRIKQGSVDVVPDTGPIAVSPEYPVYEVERSRALPRYLKIVLRSQVFRRYLEGRSHGGSSKTRIRVDDVESVFVPLPSLAYQQAIVEMDDAAARAEGEASHRLAQTRVDIETKLNSPLGAEPRSARAGLAAFGVFVGRLDRWGVGFNQVAHVGVRSGERYQRRTLGSSRTFLQYGTSVRSNDAGIGVPIIRMGNIVDGRLDVRDLRHVDLPADETGRYALRPLDILVNRTNSKELVGKSAVFDLAGTYVFASYIIRIRVRDDVFDPEFVVHVLNSEIGRSQIDMLSRRIIGQANINSAEIDSLTIPCPPLGLQRQIVENLGHIRAEAESEAEALLLEARRIRTVVETMIREPVGSPVELRG